jgi:hypothetical protein
MTELREPSPQKRKDLIPLVVYRNGVEFFEVSNYQEAFRRLKPIVSCNVTKLRDAIADGFSNHEPWYHNGHKYEFRTYEERRQRFLEEVRSKKV